MKSTQTAYLCVALAGCEGAFNPTDGLVKVSEIPVVATMTTPADEALDAGAPMLPMMPACVRGRAYVGFDGRDIAQDSTAAAPQSELRRPKPFSALATEIPRVLGTAPALLASSESTFGLIPERWESAPTMSAVSVITTFRIAFQGCMSSQVQPAKYTSTPTPTSAQAECAAWAEYFWSRPPAPDELTACVELLMNDLASESDPRRRWAYACASVLSTAAFLTF
jgi:hypothetical protein